MYFASGIILFVVYHFFARDLLINYSIISVDDMSYHNKFIVILLVATVYFFVSLLLYFFLAIFNWDNWTSFDLALLKSASQNLWRISIASFLWSLLVWLIEGRTFELLFLTEIAWLSSVIIGFIEVLIIKKRRTKK